MASLHPQAKAALTPLGILLPNPKARLKDQFHEVARFKHLSPRTETAYWEWIVRFLRFHKHRAGGWRHPREMGEVEVRAFLTDLAVRHEVSAGTQYQALNGLKGFWLSAIGYG